jgi:transposase
MAKRQFQLSEDALQQFRRAEQATRDVHELRRLQAVRLYGTGSAMASILDLLACSERSVHYWIQCYQLGGLAALASQWQGGNARKLSAHQTAELKERLHHYRPDQILPPTLRVSRGAFWTLSDLRLAVQQWFEVSYQSDDSYLKLLHDCGFSYQRTERVYRSRASDQQIADFEAELEKK